MGNRNLKKPRLSKIQTRILDCIKQSISENGYPPTIKEIGETVDLKSSASIYSQLTKLEAKGYIKKHPDRHRNIEIVDDLFNFERKEVLQVPILTTITSIETIYDKRNIRSYYPIPTDMISDCKEIFMLDFHGGDCMKEAAILDNDILLVNIQTTAEDGDIITAIVNGELVTNRFFKVDERYRLQPENDSMEPIVVEDLQIIGKVVGVFRKM